MKWFLILFFVLLINNFYFRQICSAHQWTSFNKRKINIIQSLVYHLLCIDFLVYRRLIYIDIYNLLYCWRLVCVNILINVWRSVYTCNLLKYWQLICVDILFNDLRSV